MIRIFIYYDIYILLNLMLHQFDIFFEDTIRFLQLLDTKLAATLQNLWRYPLSICRIVVEFVVMRVKQWLGGYVAENYNVISQHGNVPV